MLQLLLFTDATLPPPKRARLPPPWLRPGFCTGCGEEDCTCYREPMTKPKRKVSHDTLLKRASNAMIRLYNDRSVKEAQTAQSLESLDLEIRAMLEALHEDTCKRK